MSSDSTFVIDLDAPRREVQYPHGIPVQFHGEQYMFPAELPDAALDPLLADDLNLTGLVADVYEASERDASVSDIVLLALRGRGNLLRKVLAAVRETFNILLGDEEWARFQQSRPSISDYVRLAAGLSQVYGVELGKLFGSDVSSANDSQTSNPTSPASTDSTPDASGSAQATPASSGSAG
ncbi:hypothetical protein EV284_6499 [Streptomyces sp. BK022]|uniref:hypothetical protein n=1 Tax=Streptomyces sp. BK022 TaxID=2512123 RepID=UPI001028F921|nr:hypothetical protein [Streptomyces sp. BK022]RZU28333.1 hypothetical protein EV284_6499 [Streptomyces sp. BK022]